MKKQFIITVLLVAVCGIISINAQVKVAFVDSDAIINQLPEAQEVKKKLEDLQKVYVDTITAMETTLKNDAAAFKTKYEDAQAKVQAGNLKPEQIQALETEIAQMQQDIQQKDQQLAEYKQYVQQLLVQTQSELFKPVKEKITKIIGDVAKEMKFNFVLDKSSDAVIYGDKELDITFKVLDKMK